jgi:hypothetical protein
MNEVLNFKSSVNKPYYLSLEVMFSFFIRNPETKILVGLLEPTCRRAWWFILLAITSNCKQHLLRRCWRVKLVITLCSLRAISWEDTLGEPQGTRVPKNLTRVITLKYEGGLRSKLHLPRENKGNPSLFGVRLCYLVKQTMALPYRNGS